MVAKSASASELSSPGGGSKRFKGVRMRSWGKWVSEIRMPNTRARLWLGSYATAEEAARAFDVAVVCLRGRSASLNFPDSPPAHAPPGLPQQQIQELAAAAAAAAAPATASASSPASSTEEESDSGCQLDSAPARSTITDESDGATIEINASSECSTPVSTPDSRSALDDEYLLSEDFPFPSALLPEFMNFEWDAMWSDEPHWEHMTLCVPFLNDECPPFAEPRLWSL